MNPSRVYKYYIRQYLGYIKRQNKSEGNQAYTLFPNASKQFIPDIL